MPPEVTSNVNVYEGLIMPSMALLSSF